jgi:hypothetical protein
MLAGAGLSRIWPHDRAHWFFSHARWDPDDLALAVAPLVVSLLVPAGETVLVAIDDTLFRTIPFQLACQALAMTWYATAGHDPADIDGRRVRAPWYTSKARASTAEMTGKLRRVLIAARFKASRPDQPTPEEIHAIRLAWEAAAA